MPSKLTVFAEIFQMQIMMDLLPFSDGTNGPAKISCPPVHKTHDWQWLHFW
jgi:hypothetical protein